MGAIFLWITGVTVFLLLTPCLYALFKSGNETPSYGNLKYPMPNWMTLILALWAAMAGAAFVLIILDSWLGALLG